MIIAIILVVAAVLSLIFMFWVARRRSSVLGGVEELSSRIRPVDIQAFRTLVDPGEAQFLRMRLSHAEFRKIQRERVRAAVEYIWCAAQNAAILVRIGEAARRSGDPSIAEAGEKLVYSGIRLRILSAQALVKLYIEMILPGTRISAAELVEVYERMTRQVFVLGRLQRATASVSVSAA